MATDGDVLFTHSHVIADILEHHRMGNGDDDSRINLVNRCIAFVDADLSGHFNSKGVIANPEYDRCRDTKSMEDAAASHTNIHCDSDGCLILKACTHRDEDKRL